MILIAVGMVGMLFVRLMYKMTNRRRDRNIVDWDEAQINEEDLNDDNVVCPKITCGHMHSLNLLHLPGSGK